MVQRGGGRRPCLAADARGAIHVEYVTLLGLCAITIASAVLGWGPALLHGYARAQGIALSPFP